MPSFQSIRDVPQSGVQQWEADILNQMKINIELLTGLSGAQGRAVTNDIVATAVADNVTMKRVTAQPTGYNISGNLVADFNQFVALINNVQELANNVVSLQAQVNDLIGRLKS